ncbi:hypothetical protein ACTOB_001975 [Actinoplanes oblitus]|uniref:CopG family transcriptional regulator n=1 Tax=Actinoplanes oblitus TaxID=3040509 RepID=A0ABY8WLL2_9ACTN|nr:hypothetical protein [Actinoplanes oblitus]WIM98377.1 hypothetical protein ACTOB_001975 [Actinoplanes oblitus]
MTADANPSPDQATESEVTIQVTLPAALWRRVAEEEHDWHTPIDEMIREGLDTVLRRRAGLRAVAEWEEENGAITDEELAAAGRRLFGEANAGQTA